jgi:hypothetical protein
MTFLLRLILFAAFLLLFIIIALALVKDLGMTRRKIDKNNKNSVK